VYEPSGILEGKVTASEDVSPPAPCCGSPVSTVFPSGPITDILLYPNSIGSLKIISIFSADG
jgi:hypothetical protein